MTQLSPYLSSAYFFRVQLRAARTRRAAVEIGLVVIDEHERLREWVRAQGLIPPKWLVTPRERAAREQLAEVFPFPTTRAVFPCGAAKSDVTFAACYA